MSAEPRGESELKALVKDLARETLDRYREINLLYRASETIGACLNTAAVPGLVLQEAQRVISSPVSVVVGADHATQESRGASEDVSELMTGAAALLDRVLSTGRPDIDTWDGSSRGATSGAGLSSALAVPIRAGESVHAAVLLGRRPTDPDFTAGDEKLLLGLASQAGVALERARLHEQETLRQRMDEELSVARRIQLSLLPAHLPRIDGWSFAAAYSAARQVGGDFYDFMDHALTERRLGLVVADVAGKGVPAALMMAFARALLRAEAMAGRPPAELLERTNRLIMGDRVARPFLTAFYAEFDFDSGRMAYANAGHDPPVLVSGAGECRRLDTPGVILGAFDDIALEQADVSLAPGDAVVFYTDGVTEARNPAGEFLGDDALLEAARAGFGSAQSVLDSIVGTVGAFTAGAEQADDVTIVVVQRNSRST